MRKLVIFAALCAIPLAAQEQGKGGGQKPPVLEKPKDAQKVNDENGKLVEEIIARVNNEIITRSELDKAVASAEEDAKQDCQNQCTPEQLQQQIDDGKKHALRNLIDQSLLVQRGKDKGYSVEADLIKQLDGIRVQNKLESLEELEKAVSGSGVNWEDFKANIRNQILTRRVIEEDVASKVNIGQDEMKKFYEEHQKEFIKPEQVALREIRVSTEGKSEAELPELKKKAETALKRVKDGEDFGEIAKRFSDGSTAKENGGYIGTYSKGQLSKPLEDIVFKMKKNDLTDVLDTKQGYLVLQVLERYEEGQQPFEKVENEIRNHLMRERMQPALREYLKTLREQSYVIIKPGFQDIAGGGNSEIQEVNATPEVTKAKKGHKKYLLFGKRTGSTSTS